MSSKARSKQAHCNRSEEEKSVSDGEPWSMLLAKRHGAPPIRFKGREVARHVDGRPGVEASVTLWERKTQGFVAAIDAGGWVDSTSADDLEETMDWLEGHGREDEVERSPRSLERLLSDTPREIAARRHLRIVIGEALDHWEQLREHGAVRAPRERATT